MAVTLATVYQTQMKAGANVSASGGDTNFITNFIEEAEGVVCARARYDFISNFASLNAYTKQLLRALVTSWAAMKAIDYDMSGFSTRVEAETMLDVLRDDFVKAIEALESMDVQEFLGVK